MKKPTFSILLLFTIINLLSAQTTNSDKIRYDGLYCAKTVEIQSDVKIEIYCYIRFYADGSVVTQTVNSYSPDNVAKWLGKNGRFERKGNVTIKESAISFPTNNDKSQDKALEGAMSTNYEGVIKNKDELSLNITYHDGETKGPFAFKFVQTAE